jgi:riboflavin kinase/FMN adenylyltransferase
LKNLVQEAWENQGESIVISFDPHPKVVLFPDDHHMEMIQTTEEKSKSLADIGIDHLILLPFSLDIALQSAEDFIKEVLVLGLHVKKVCVGYDHRFGRNRTGDFNLLVQMGELFGFEVSETSAFQPDGYAISSTKIRKALKAGDMEQAEQALGRPFTFSGKVVHGKKLGRTIGFPTANVVSPDPLKIVPALGIYAAQVLWENNCYPAAVSVSTNPTVTSLNQIHIEAYLLNFNDDLYDKTVEIRWIKKIRDEKKFNSLEELKIQISLDVECVKNLV